MNNEKLVSMANQIAAFFNAYPEADAVVGLRDHIRLFWTPRMRRKLDTRIKGSTNGIDPLVLRALAPTQAP